MEINSLALEYKCRVMTWVPMFLTLFKYIVLIVTCVYTRSNHRCLTTKALVINESFSNKHTGHNISYYPQVIAEIEVEVKIEIY